MLTLPKDCLQLVAPKGYLLAVIRREGVLDLDDPVLVGGDRRVVDDRLAHDLVGLLTVHLRVAEGDVEVVVRELRATEGANLPAASAPAVEVLHGHLDERLCVGVVRAAADDDRDDLLEGVLQTGHIGVGLDDRREQRSLVDLAGGGVVARRDGGREDLLQGLRFRLRDVGRLRRLHQARGQRGGSLSVQRTHVRLLLVAGADHVLVGEEQ